jgi:hypothetical protein
MTGNQPASALLLVEFDDAVPKAIIEAADDSSFNFMNLDTATPCLRIGATVLVGEYQPVVGTAAIFADPGTSDEAGDDDDLPRFHGQTTRKLVFRLPRALDTNVVVVE